MKKLFFPLLLIFSIFLIFSCDSKRDENGDLLFGVDDNPITDTETGTSRLLKKTIEHTFNDETNEWEDITTTYNYTNNKLTSVSDGVTTSTIEYNSNNKISKVTTGSEQVSVFEYSGNNLSKITTTFTGIGTIVGTFVYNSGKLVKIISIQDYSLPFPMKYYFEAENTFTGNNVTKTVVKPGIYLPNGDLQMMPDENNIFDIKYDTKKNPFNLLPKEFFIMFISIAPQGGAFLSANNPTEIKTVNTAGTETQVSIYIYDNENYPIKMTSGEEFFIYEYQ